MAASLVRRPREGGPEREEARAELDLAPQNAEWLARNGAARAEGWAMQQLLPLAAAGMVGSPALSVRLRWSPARLDEGLLSLCLPHSRLYGESL